MAVASLWEVHLAQMVQTNPSVSKAVVMGGTNEGMNAHGMKMRGTIVAQSCPRGSQSTQNGPRILIARRYSLAPAKAEMKDQRVVILEM